MCALAHDQLLRVQIMRVYNFRMNWRRGRGCTCTYPWHISFCVRRALKRSAAHLIIIIIINGTNDMWCRRTIDDQLFSICLLI